MIIGKIIKKMVEVLPHSKFWKLYDSMKIIKEYCDDRPTCENCVFRENHIGCMFRNTIPREW